MSGRLDIHEEIAKAQAAFDACPRWRLWKRRGLLDHLLMCQGVLRTFEQARRDVSA